MKPPLSAIFRWVGLVITASKFRTSPRIATCRGGQTTSRSRIFFVQDAPKETSFAYGEASHG